MIKLLFALVFLSLSSIAGYLDGMIGCVANLRFLMLIFWVILGASLLILEIFTPSFFALFFGLGSLAAALIYYFTACSLSLQIAAFILTSCLFLLIFRKALKRKFIKKSPPLSPNMIGEVGVVISPISPLMKGRVNIRDIQWNATSQSSLEVGQKVIVLSLDNLTLEVKPL